MSEPFASQGELKLRPPEPFVRFAVVKRLLKKIRGLLERALKWNAHEDGAPDRVGYTSVPYWRPWRDF
jgi:hypothetical protein